jgi:hypothetical protein
MRLPAPAVPLTTMHSVDWVADGVGLVDALLPPFPD